LKALVIYDSVFGNTEKIAQAVARGLSGAHETQCVRAGSVSLAQIQAADIVIMCSPTRSFAATPATTSVLESIPTAALQGKKVAAFDTRILMTGVKGLLFRKIIDKGGYAAPIIASALVQKDGTLACPAEGFFVKGEEGPLVNGELERAVEWGKKLA
jgi:flavodoxin I